MSIQNLAPCERLVAQGSGAAILRLRSSITVLLVNDPALDVSTEPLLLPRQLLLERLVRLPDRFDLEQALHLLQWDTTSLWDEEEGIEEREEGQRREEEVHAVAHRGEHLFGESRHEEVEQPVAGRCAGLGYGAEVGVEEFLVMPC